MMCWLVLKLEINYRVIVSWRILVSFRGILEDYIFCMVKYLRFHKSSFAFRYFKCKWQDHSVTHRLLTIYWRQVTLGEIPGTTSKLKTWRFSVINLIVLNVKQFCNLPIHRCSIPFDHAMLCLLTAVHISVPTVQSQSWRHHSCLSIFALCNT
jgi:hypothetical protein